MRRSLLRRARSAFASAGYAGTSLDDVVAAAGATKGALYHHFDGKHALFEAVVRDIHAELEAASLLGAAPGDDPWEQFIETCRGYLRGLLDAGTRRILLVEAPAVLGAARERSLDHELTVGPLTAWFTALADQGALAITDPEALARLVSGALTEIALWMGESERPETELERGIAILAQLLAGLRGVGSGRRKRGS